MTDATQVLARTGTKIAILVGIGVLAALIVTFTVTPGPGSISLAGAAWGLAIWLGVLTIAVVALMWQVAALTAQQGES